MTDRPRCLDWVPLATHNCLRLRNLIQIIGQNIDCKHDDTTHLYFTLHTTPMSSPFYKSNAVEMTRDGTCRWPEIHLPDKMGKSSATCVCVRVWEQRAPRNNNNNSSLGDLMSNHDDPPTDTVLMFWGIYFSGLVPVLKRTEARYRKNTLVFQMHGGLFASADTFDPNYISKAAFPSCLPNFQASMGSQSSLGSSSYGKKSLDPYDRTQNCDENKLFSKVKRLSSTPNKGMLPIKSSPDLTSLLWNGSPSKFSPLNDNNSSFSSSFGNANDLGETFSQSGGESLVKFRYLKMEFKETDVRRSYSVNKLLLLQEKQRRIKNQMEECAELRERIYTKSAYCLNLDMIANHASLLYKQPKVLPGMGRQLSRLLYQEEAPQKPEDILKGQELRRQIEVAKFRCKGLRDERDRMKIELRHTNERLTKISDRNILLESETMSRYRGLSKETDQLMQKRMAFASQRDILERLRHDLFEKRKRLIRDLQEIYPIAQVHNELFTIQKVPLPNAEAYRLYTVSPMELSIALGFTSHVIILCSRILNVPLRNNVIHEGSRSRIEDNIKPIAKQDRIFPLFCRSNPPPQNLLYGVFLLNQNILQIKHYLGMKITDTRATLPNLLNILDGVPVDTTVFSLYQNPAAPASSVSGSSSVDLNSSISNILGDLKSSPIEINGTKSKNRICRSLTDSEHQHIPTRPLLRKSMRLSGSEPSLCEIETSSYDGQHERPMLISAAMPQSKIQMGKSNTTSNFISERDENL
ncbi:UV radiation resistance-associated gene protein [Culicoides brevitarsis]|uniref:UV radiation resistance-associated gene protein n=1 Tax=Culicoides brevitarsis TaxID=469753 RepID=UPI00307B2CC1